MTIQTAAQATAAEAKLIAKLSKIANAEVTITAGNAASWGSSGHRTVKYRRAGVGTSVPVNYDMNEVQRAIEDGGRPCSLLVYGAEIAKKRLDEWVPEPVANGGGPYVPVDNPWVRPPSAPRMNIYQVYGKDIAVPEDEDLNKAGKTVGERFDAIRAACLAANKDLMVQVGRYFTCQVWATVKQVDGTDLNIVSDEDWEFLKFVYRGGVVGEMVAILKSLPDQNGKGGKQEIMVTRRDLEDCFPDLYEIVDAAIKQQGYIDFPNFAAEIKALVGNRREFAQALIDMSNNAVTAAIEHKETAVKDEREGFYQNQKGFALF